MNGDEGNQNDVDFAAAAAATTTTERSSSTTLFPMLPVSLLEYILVEYLDVRSLATLGECCYDMDEKVVTDIALSSKTWDKIESKIIKFKDGKSLMAKPGSLIDRCLRYYIADEYASNIESNIIRSVKVLKKDKLIWNYDGPEKIPRWHQQPFESIHTTDRSHEYFIRISMLKFNNDDDSSSSSSSSSEQQESTLVWKGFLQTVIEQVEWAGEYTVRLKFPGDDVAAGIPWGLCGFDAFGESWGETEGPMITVVAVKNKHHYDNNNNNNTDRSSHQVVVGGVEEEIDDEPTCCFVLWDALANDWTEYEFDDGDGVDNNNNNRIIKRSMSFPLLGTQNSRESSDRVPFRNAEFVNGESLDLRTAKIRTERDKTGCRLLELDIYRYS